jgi:hypothetical protein
MMPSQGCQAKQSQASPSKAKPSSVFLCLAYGMDSTYSLPGSWPVMFRKTTVLLEKHQISEEMLIPRETRFSEKNCILFVSRKI